MNTTQNLLSLFIVIPLLVSQFWSVAAATKDDQYIVVNIASSEVNSTVFEEIKGLSAAQSSDKISIGIAAIFSYLNEPRETTRDHLEKFLALSQQHSIPVVVQLDGEQWWGARPDLWNWWDPTKPGFNPANRKNVEWSGWGEETALKLAWRNWGRQIRVTPPPNLESPRYRQACHAEMRLLIPIVLKWWQQLPQDSKHLLIGIKLGWESSIGVNAFYYPNGNDYFDQPEANDPVTGLKSERLPDRGVATIGYAALTTSQLASEGELRAEDLVKVVHHHISDLCGLAAEIGVPRDKLFNHVGGWKEEEGNYDAAVNQFSCPGWSFYKYSADPAQDKGVRRALAESDAPYWAAVEWLTPGGGNKAAWQGAMTQTLSMPKCRYLCIFNWKDIRQNDAALSAIRGLLSQERKPGATTE